MSDVLVWFDGACPLCRREIAWMRRLDRRNAIAFVEGPRSVYSTRSALWFDILQRFRAMGVRLS